MEIIVNFGVTNKFGVILEFKRRLDKIGSFADAEYLLDNFKFERFNSKTKYFILNGFSKIDFFQMEMWSILMDLKEMGYVIFDVIEEDE